eukprot:scaffold302_cov91-Skeletonema_dohrnii-CCMP3373.AAC.1
MVQNWQGIESDMEFKRLSAKEQKSYRLRWKQKVIDESYYHLKMNSLYLFLRTYGKDDSPPPPAHWPGDANGNAAAKAAAAAIPINLPPPENGTNYSPSEMVRYWQGIESDTTDLSAKVQKSYRLCWKQKVIDESYYHLSMESLKVFLRTYGKDDSPPPPAHWSRVAAGVCAVAETPINLPLPENESNYSPSEMVRYWQGIESDIEHLSAGDKRSYRLRWKQKVIDESYYHHSMSALNEFLAFYGKDDSQPPPAHWPPAQGARVAAAKTAVAETPINLPLPENESNYSPSEMVRYWQGIESDMEIKRLSAKERGSYRLRWKQKVIDESYYHLSMSALNLFLRTYGKDNSPSPPAHWPGDATEAILSKHLVRNKPTEILVKSLPDRDRDMMEGLFGGKGGMFSFENAGSVFEDLINEDPRLKVECNHLIGEDIKSVTVSTLSALATCESCIPANVRKKIDLWKVLRNAFADFPECVSVISSGTVPKDVSDSLNGMGKFTVVVNLDTSVLEDVWGTDSIDNVMQLHRGHKFVCGVSNEKSLLYLSHAGMDCEYFKKPNAKQGMKGEMVATLLKEVNESRGMLRSQGEMLRSQGEMLRSQGEMLRSQGEMMMALLKEVNELKGLLLQSHGVLPPMSMMMEELAKEPTMFEAV